MMKKVSERFFITKLKRVGDSGSPCRRSSSLQNCVVGSPSMSKEKDAVEIYLLIILTIRQEKFIDRSVISIALKLIESKAFVKSR